MKIKNQKNEKIIIQKKTPQNYHGLWVPNLINFLFKKKKKLPWPMSAKSDTHLPGFIYYEIRIFLDRLWKPFSSR